jgi:hypothetical protein
MKTAVQRIVIGALLLIACQSLLLAQIATVSRNVPLHRDASAGSPAIEHLPKGTRLVLVDAAAQGGFYHVRTEDEQVGWVWSKYISVSQDGPLFGTVTHTHPDRPLGSGAQCDTSLWNHVYHPQRLIVIEQCISVTGTIVDATAGKQRDGVRHERDGDTHGWLKVDPEFTNLLNAGNQSYEGGNLVFEIVCKFPVTQPDAKAACKGYMNKIAIPPIDSHVRIVGTYVQDTFHAQWMEIHPVTSITVVP